MVQIWYRCQAALSSSQAESQEALAATLKDHPHLRSAERFIEIVEMMPMPTK